MTCVDQWRADPFRSCSLSCKKGPPCGLPMIDLSTLLGPPEVRVVRLSLTTRPQDVRGPTELPRAPRPPRLTHSPLRLRPRRTRKKKGQKTSGGDTDNNKLPLSVTLGRALGAQVQPLMAILMSPRVRSSSLHSDDSAEDERSEDEAKTSPKSKTPLLSITSLELPDLAPARNPACQPVRRVRTSVRRSRPPPPQCTVTNAQAQNISCAGLALTKK
ncbi:uncharacterized protein LOC128993619 [Macrosteles quadrilineatus]|uniref:uncharacterized protein LOC128993619 n=1 Tax=Macrosteles quadrilineatus TaxID=74068 RepID=UPI0023E297BF|nr:uncharacterized protein LOC128993619 [Macrosteles quadrilineatus]